jgi:carbonic anhydrase/acetyltransferase-like protein (isoleucine patch superfamily)
MLVSRSGIAPRIDPSARVATTASIVGDVTIGPECYVDYGVVIASSGPPVILGEGVTVLANAVIRSCWAALRCCSRSRARPADHGRH